MSQYNMHSELNEFYEKNVRLKGEIDRLRELRDTNLNRLSDGLKALDRPNFTKSLLQGSIAMHTANKAPNNDYDIDIAVIFEKDDLPASPLEARKRVAAAIKEKATGFSQEPEARANAVTIWYADGYHVDIAVYRRYKNWLGFEVLEHAGTEWAERDPKAITDWFINDVTEQSPSEGIFVTPGVAPKQMRRIVRWIKAFTKAREGWILPGGLVISTLVSECYKPHNDRDDIALYNTLEAIKSRLDYDCTVNNPTDSSKELTEKQKFLTEVKNLKKRLGSVLSKLEALFKDDCDDSKAQKAWNYMFQHDYWTPEATNLNKSANDSRYTLDLKMGIAQSQGGLLTGRNVKSGCFLPKRKHLKFEVNTNVPKPYTVKWTAINTGEEAEAANHMGHTSTSENLTHWERTAYRGKHELVCEIMKQGSVVVSKKQVVNIR
mgnify:CR=1 FL=1